MGDADTGDGEPGWEGGFLLFFILGAAEVHGLGGGVGVLESAAGVEEDHAVCGLQLSCGDEAVVGGGGGGSLGGEEDALVLGPVEDALEDRLLRGADGLAAGLG